MKGPSTRIGSALVALLCLGLPAPSVQAFSAESVTAYTNATLIDGQNPAQSNMTVLVTGRLISAVYRSGSRQLPAGARVVDLTGKFLIPGLIDSHVHLGTQMRDPGVMQQILGFAFMHGITTVRDMGGNLVIVRPLAAAARSDTVRSPRIFYSAIFAGPGRWFEGEFGDNARGGLPIGTSPAVRLVDDHTNARIVVAEAKRAGVTGIKIYNTVSTPMINALVREAHRQGLRAWSHFSVGPGRPSDVLASGIEVVSHADQFRSQLLTPAAMGSDSVSRALRGAEVKAMSPDMPAFNALLATMKKRGTMLDPTLSIMVPREVPKDTSRANMERIYGTFHFAAAMTRRANRAGIPIIAGTDAIGGSSANLHAELQMMVDSAGLTPLEALRAATLNGARALGLADSLGSIAPGKIADMVILCADPTLSIRNTQAVAVVIKGGQEFSRTNAPRLGPHSKPPDRSCF